jgi:hypothetical protein
MNDTGIIETIIKHTSVLDVLEKSIFKIETSNERQDEKIGVILEKLNQNVLLVEKIEHIDESNREAIKRVHNRIDEGFEQMDKISKKAEKGDFIYSIFILLSASIPVIALILSGLFYLINHA